LAGSLVPEGDVQLAILAKVEGAALVAGRNLATEFRLIVAFQQDFLAPRLGRVAHRGEATDDVVRVRLGSAPAAEDVRRLREARGTRPPDQAAFPGRIHRQLEERLREQLALFDDPECPRLLTGEDAAVGSDFERRRSVQAGSDDFGLETRG